MDVLMMNCYGSQATWQFKSHLSSCFPSLINWQPFARTGASNHNRVQTKNNSLSYIKLPVIRIIPESFSKNISQSCLSFVCIIVFLLHSCLMSVLEVAVQVGVLLIERFLMR